MIDMLVDVVSYFFLWTFVLYCIHRLAHQMPVIKYWHWNHHSYIVRHGSQGWRWNNLVLYNDTPSSTLDLYFTEVIPTVIFSWITGHWWIFIGYYIWAAFFQEALEHNKNVDVPLFTKGKWHMIHHTLHNKNYGLFLTIWDIIFRTYKRVDK